MKKLFYFAFLLSSFLTFSQQIKYRGNGEIVNTNNEKLTSKEVKKLLEYNPALLEYYSNARDKKIFGNILLVGGSTLIISDLAIGLTSGSSYPSTLTYIGAASIILAIPIKIGFSKKIEKVTEDFNNELISKKSTMTIENIKFITNQKGFGLQITF